MPGGKFIAKDARGAQLSVEVGTGIPSVEPVSGSQTNFKVTFLVEGLKYPVYGYIDSNGNESLIAYLREAQTTGEAVHFRIESRRKPSVDLHRPWHELDHKQHIRKLLAQAGGVWSSEVADNLADDVEVDKPATVIPLKTASPFQGDVCGRIREFGLERPDLLGLVTAVAAVTTHTPIKDLLALLPQHNKKRPVSPVDPGRVLFDPGHDVIADGDTIAKTNVAAPIPTPVANIATLGKLVKLMRLSGVDPTEVASWIRSTYNVQGVQYLPEEELQVLLATYRAMGPERGPVAFAHDVRSLA